jgi:hypothetical protein
MKNRSGFLFPRGQALACAVAMLAAAATAWASPCEDRCEARHQAAVRFCYGDTGALPGDTESCLEQAMEDYRACLDDCRR